MGRPISLEFRGDLNCYELGIEQAPRSSFTYDFFFPGITTFETVMVSPFISPVSRTV